MAMQCRSSFNRIIMAASLVLAGFMPHYAWGDVAASVASGITVQSVLDDARAKIDAIIGQATRSGDYILGRAAIVARDSINEWEKANKSILGVALDGLDKASRDNFARINSTIDALENKSLDAIGAARQLTDGAQQVVANIPTNKRTYIIRHSPVVVYPGRPGPVIIKLTGVNIDTAGLQLKLSDGVIFPKVPSAQEAIFEIPPDVFSFDEKNIKINSFLVTYTSRLDGFWNSLLGRKASISREITVLALPRTLGVIELSSAMNQQDRETRRRDFMLPQYRGRNTDQSNAIPASEGWRIDLGTLQEVQHNGGGNSGCTGFPPHLRSEQGITHTAHVGEIKNFNYPRGADGYVNCQIIFNEYRIVNKSVPGVALRDALTWTSDVVMDLGPAVQSFLLRIDTFDGISKAFLNSATEKYYQVINDGARVVIRPQIPRDIF